MGTRRKSRELTMQMLFQGDLGKQSAEQVGKLFWASAADATAASMSAWPAMGTWAWTWPVLGLKTSAVRLD